MKRIINSLALTVLAVILSSGVALAQEANKTADELQKQKEAKEIQKKQVVIKEDQKKIQEENKEVQKKLITEEEIAKKMAEIEAGSEKDEYERALKDAEWMMRDTDGRPHRTVIRIPDEQTFNVTVPDLDRIYFYNHDQYMDKPGSSWNYSRQVFEATFTDEYTMNSGEEYGNVNLSVSGDCDKGSIAVAIIMPDGKQLSEIVIDANGSLNWRKSFEGDDTTAWKSGKWIFRINAKNATGNFRISLSAH